jgi:parvulin-like peptidyl-prolyl isomerase
MLDCSRYSRHSCLFITRTQPRGLQVSASLIVAVLTLVFAFFAPGDAAGQKPADGTAMVATYDNGGITVDEFVSMYRQAAAKYADYDMTTYKSELLANMATNELLGREAAVRGFVDEKGEWDLKVIETKEKAMINQLRRDVIVKDVDVSEEFVRGLYDKSSVRRLTRLISVSNRADADQVIRELEGGADFVEVAKEWSLDIDSVRWNALLAWMKIGDGPQNVEDLVFGIELGEIGAPVETLQGYSIFRVDSLFYKEDIPSYEEARLYYRSKALARARAPINIAFMDSVAEARGLRFDEKTMALVIERFETDGWLKNDEPGRASKIPEFTPEEYAMPVFSFEGGSASLDEYLEYVGDNLANPAYFLAGREEMERGLAGFARRNIELIVAYEMGMDEVASVRGQVRKKAKGLGIVDLLVDVAGGNESVKTTDEERRAFYEENKWKYTEPGAIIISIVTVTDMDIVDQLYEDMQNGIPVEKLANDYRWVLDESRTSGRMVLAKEEQENHPEIFNTARRMKVGEVSEPIPVPGRNDVQKGLSVIRLLEREPSKVIPYEEIKEEVRVDLNLQILSAAAGTIEEFKQSVRDKYNYKVNDEILSSIKL